MSISASDARPSNRVRRVLAVLLTLALSWAGSTLIAPAASATTAVTCAGYHTVHNSPGLTNTPAPHQITITGYLTSCAHVVNGSVTTMTGSYGPTVITRTTSCSDLLDVNSATRVFTWSNGSTSTFPYTSTTTEVAGNLVITLVGSISAGLYAGSVATQQIVLEGAAGLSACATAQGLTDLSGTTSLTIDNPLG